MSPADMIRRLGRLQLQTAAEQAIQETSDEYVQLNTEQLYEGKNSLGQPLSPLYASPKYARVKNEMNPAPGLGTPDLKLTGAFYEGMSVELQGDKIVEDSNVDYADDLYQKYQGLAGLDDQNMTQYRQGPFREALQEKVEEQFYG